MYMSPLDKAQWPQVKVSPETIKMSRGLGSEITGHTQNERWDHWDWNAEQRVKVGWKDGNCILPPGGEMLHSLAVTVVMFWISKLTLLKEGKGEVVWWCRCPLAHYSPIALTQRGRALISVKQAFPAHILQHTVQQALRYVNWWGSYIISPPKVHLEPEPLCLKIHKHILLALYSI